MTAIGEQDFKQVMRRFATGVTVVTFEGEGKLYGLTVNSFTSVSLDPMLVLICIDKRVTGYEWLQPGQAVAVNILSEKQESVSRWFATKRENKFEGHSYSIGTTGAPLLDSPLAFLECRIVQAYEGGDHTIFLAEVEKAKVLSDGQPLLFFGGAYRALGGEPAAAKRK